MSDSKITIADGIISNAVHCPSPNYDDRPQGESISLLVIHNISLPPGQFGGGFVHKLFTNTLNPAEHPFFQEIAGLEVSAHLLIERSGEVTQFVPFHRMAWHAGVSCYQGREKCNDFAIGIELEGTDSTPYSDHQYDALTTVTRALMEHYPELTSERITGHCDIAPARKTDPGPFFDWNRYKQQL